MLWERSACSLGERFTNGLPLCSSVLIHIQGSLHSKDCSFFLLLRLHVEHKCRKQPCFINIGTGSSDPLLAGSGLASMISLCSHAAPTLSCFYVVNFRCAELSMLAMRVLLCTVCKSKRCSRCRCTRRASSASATCSPSSAEMR